MLRDKCYEEVEQGQRDECVESGSIRYGSQGRADVGADLKACRDWPWRCWRMNVPGREKTCAESLRLGSVWFV